MKRRAASGDVDGVYANYVEIGHNRYEFVLDFGQRYGDHANVFLVRIVTHPVYARALLDTLEDALRQYELEWGEQASPPAV